jgi:hypothetical protein
MRLVRRSLQVRNGVWRLGNRSGSAITVLRIPIFDLTSTVYAAFCFAHFHVPSFPIIGTLLWLD